MANENTFVLSQGRTLIWLGVLLFLIGLLTGFAVHALANPRMGLSSHLEALMNGMFLIILGLIWPRIELSRTWLRVTFWLAVYAAFANWFTTLLAAAWAAGSSMPIAGLGGKGSATQELVINSLLFSLSFAMIIVCVAALWGLRIQAKSDRAERV